MDVLVIQCVATATTCRIDALYFLSTPLTGLAAKYTQDNLYRCSLHLDINVYVHQLMQLFISSIEH